MRCALSGCRPAELVVGDAGAERPVDEVLKLSAAAGVALDDVELLVGAEAEDAAVVVPALRLAGILLQRAES